MLYFIHRAGHSVSIIKKIHAQHHRHVYKNTIKWHWNNLFLYNDGWLSTLDLWITEVIPTLIFCVITGWWWIFWWYYIWTAFIQEHFEHNPKIHFPPFTFGKWHMIHHKNSNVNFGLFFPIWDKLFGTEIKVK